MPKLYVDRAAILEFLHQLDATFGKPGRLYLMGKTTQVVEGWREWTKCGGLWRIKCETRK